MDASPFQSSALGAAGGGLILTGEDNLRLTTWGAVAGAVVALEGRFLDACGLTIPFAESQTPNTDRSAKTTIYPAREGLLTNLHLRVATGTVLHGGVGALVEIVRGRDGGVQPLGTLLQGYVTTATRLAWPGSPVLPLPSGPGRLRVILGTNPAAGSEISETVPTGARWRLISFRYTITTSGTVANRSPVLTIDDGTNVLWETWSNVAVTASSTVAYNAGAGAPFLAYNTAGNLLPLPTTLELPGGSRIRTVTGNLQAGDDFAAPVYTVLEYIEQ